MKSSDWIVNHSFQVFNPQFRVVILHIYIDTHLEVIQTKKDYLISVYKKWGYQRTGLDIVYPNCPILTNVSPLHEIIAYTVTIIYESYFYIPLQLLIQKKNSSD